MTSHPHIPFSHGGMNPENADLIGDSLRALPENEVEDWMEGHRAWFARACDPAWFEAAVSRNDNRVMEILATHPVTAPALLFWLHRDLGKTGENDASALCRWGVHFPDLMTLPVISANCKRPASLVERLGSNGDWRTVAALEEAGVPLAGPASSDPLWILTRRVLQEHAEDPDGTNADMLEAASWLAGLARRQPDLFSTHRPVSNSQDTLFILEHKVSNLLLDHRLPGAFHALAWAIEHLGWSLDDPMEMVFGERGQQKGTWRDEWTNSGDPQKARLIAELEAIRLDRQLHSGQTPSVPRLRL